MDDLHRAYMEELTRRMSPEQRIRHEATQAELEAVLKELHAQVAEAREHIAALGFFERAISLEKSWHILHYLFTGHAGSASAPGDLLLTGEAVGDDGGYGPARLHGPTQTQEFSRFLKAQDLARLQARVDFEQMGRLGILYSPRGPGSDAEFQMIRDEVGFYFPLLRDYVGAMSDKGNGLLVWVS